MNACTEAAIRFFTAKYEFLQLYPNGHSVFRSEIQNPTVALKQPFVFHSEIRNLELYHSFFDYKIQNFLSFSKTVICFLPADLKI